jgi:hypothetical protein
MKKCLELQKKVLGCHYPDIETSLEALNEWGMENFEVRL